MMIKNEIKDNSTGIQAGRDVSISQYKLPEAIEEMIVEILQPTIREAGEQLRKNLSADLNKSIGNQLRTVIENDVLSSLKEEINAKNISYHINKVKAKVESLNRKKNIKSSDIEYEINKIALFGEWIENVENISNDEKLLSEIWEEWLVALSEGKSISEHKLYLERMKQLTSDDAVILLRFKKRNSVLPRQSSIEEYIYQKLVKLELIKKDYSLVLTYGVLITILIFISLFLVNIDNLFSEFGFLMGKGVYLILFVSIFPIYIFLRESRYKLTWLGKAILGFSEKEHKVEKESE